MNKIIILPLLFFLAFCNSKKVISNVPEITVKEIKLDTIPTPCPENGICTIEILKNKTLNVSLDEFGKNYYTLGDDEFKKVIKYSFTKNKDPKYIDSGYREEILFEIDNSDTQLSLRDLSFQKTKMIFGRLCYCKGATGYYKVEKGFLTLKKEKTGYLLNLSFKVNEVPQIITEINRYIP